MIEIEYRPMVLDDSAEVRSLVERTVRESYRGAYSEAAIEFFVRYHGEDEIRKDIEKGFCIVACMNGRIVGTATLRGDTVTRVFVGPELQGKGIGGHLMRMVLDRAWRSGLEAVHLDASLVSRGMYEHLGFAVVADRNHDLGDGEGLPYHEMVLRL